METKDGLIIAILIYFILLFVSVPLYYHMCNYLEHGLQSAFMTYLIAYALDSICISCLMKFGFNHGLFETVYAVMMNVFPFTFFYLVGMASIFNFIDYVNWVHTFMNI